MGRSAQTEPPVDVEVVQASFAIRQDGRLVHGSSSRSDHAGEPAGFMVGDRPMVRLSVGGKTRRIAVLRAAWMIAHGAAPRGVVQPKDGDPWNADPANLVLGRHCAHKPHLKGSSSSSLVRRRAARIVRCSKRWPTTQTPAWNSFSALTGVARGRVSTRLIKLATQGLTQVAAMLSRQIVGLTTQGRTVAIGMSPLLDDLDRLILTTIAQTPMGPARLGRDATPAR